jgi:cysteine desulfuration protein SufE
MRTLSDILEEYEFLEGDDRYGLLIELGRALEPMPDALKTDATLVRGCSAAVWVYPAGSDGAALHFLADSNGMDVMATLAPFDLKNQLSSNRTQGVPNMIALVKEHAARLVGS